MTKETFTYHLKDPETGLYWNHSIHDPRFYKTPCSCPSHKNAVERYYDYMLMLRLESWASKCPKSLVIETVQHISNTMEETPIMEMSEEKLQKLVSALSCKIINARTERDFVRAVVLRGHRYIGQFKDLKLSKDAFKELCTNISITTRRHNGLVCLKNVNDFVILKLAGYTPNCIYDIEHQRLLFPQDFHLMSDDPVETNDPSPIATGTESSSPR